MGKKWLPLESNPDVLNDFVSKLGYDTSKYSFCDVFGLDEVRLSSGLPALRQHTHHMEHIFQTCVYAGAAANGTPAGCGCAVFVSSNKGVGGCQRSRYPSRLAYTKVFHVSFCKVFGRQLVWRT